MVTYRIIHNTHLTVVHRAEYWGLKKIPDTDSSISDNYMYAQVAVFYI